MRPEELIGKRVSVGDGTGKVVSIRRRDGNGRATPPMAVVRYDGFDSVALVRLTEIARLNDYRFEAL